MSRLLTPAAVADQWCTLFEPVNAARHRITTIATTDDEA